MAHKVSRLPFQSDLARCMHYCFFGSGSPVVVNSSTCEIETRQYLGCWFLPAIKVFFLPTPKTTTTFDLKTVLGIMTCMILIRIKKIHMVYSATLLND